MSPKAKIKRARGRAYPCACGEEKLRLTREDARGIHAEGWDYLWGECAGGVKLRWERSKVVEIQPVTREEAERIKRLPARRIDPYGAMLERLEDKERGRLNEIVGEVQQALAQGMREWTRVGGLLAEAKKLLKKGDFGLWVEHHGLDRGHAFRFISAFEVVDAARRFSPTWEKIGHFKLSALRRLPATKRLELLQEGVPINGQVKPLTDVTYRELHAYVQGVVGKDSRGRKAKEKPPEAPRPTERFGLPIDLVEAIQGAVKSLQALKIQIKRGALEGLTNKQRLALSRLWSPAHSLAYELQNDYGMGALVEERR